MLQDIRIIKYNKINALHVLISEKNILFYIKIILKYAKSIKSVQRHILNYLLKQNSSFGSFNPQVIHRSVENYLANKKNRRTTQPWIQNSISNENITNIILNKKQQSIRQISQQQNVSVRNEQAAQINKIIPQALQIQSINSKKIINSIKSQLSWIQNTEFKKEIVHTLHDHKISHNPKVFQKNNILKKEKKDISFNDENIIHEKLSPETTLIYSTQQNKVLPQENSNNTIGTNSTDSTVADHPLSATKTIENINHYEIRQLAQKVYPLVIKQWQKEFERRGVFYG